MNQPRANAARFVRSFVKTETARAAGQKARRKFPADSSGGGEDSREPLQ
jgi:hypothetical protein